MWWRLALTLALAGCSQSGLNLGVTTGSVNGPAAASGWGAQRPQAERIGANLYRVPASDRRIDDTIARENYAMLRAAETARAAGATHFIIVKAGDVSAQTVPTISSLTGSTTDYGAYVRVVTVAPGTEAPIGAIAADEIIHFFGPQFAARPATPVVAAKATGL